MCDGRNKIKVWINGHYVKIDECMVGIVTKLIADGYETIACCCGHGKYSKTILIRNEVGEVVEYFSGKIIERQRRFYFKDKDNGLYYIPEIEND